jgi:dTDP-4-dehydrorhamnose reductase
LIARVPTVTGIASSEYPTRAVRPAYSVLDTDRLRIDFALSPPDWRQGLRQVITELMVVRGNLL